MNALLTAMILSFLLFSWFSKIVLANTEIRNLAFSAAFPLFDTATLSRLTFAHEGVDGHRGLIELSAKRNERRFDVLPARLWTPLSDVCNGTEAGECENEVWLKLALGESWEGYEAFTLRVSWPAFVRCLNIYLLLLRPWNWNCRL